MSKNKATLLKGITDIKTSKLVAKNTVKIEFNNGSIAYRLHETNVITFESNGNIILNSGGWQTQTTKERINTFSPFTVSQNKGIWTVRTSKGSFDFFDSITFDETGNCLNEQKADLKAIEEMKKKIKKFVSLITKDNLPIPDAGDCWDCCLHTKEGLSMGDMSGNHSHLHSHLEENYLHGSLLVNAMREKGYTDKDIQWCYNNSNWSVNSISIFKRALRAYLQKRLIQNIAVKGHTILHY